mgnify:CR=1 FL=1
MILDYSLKLTRQLEETKQALNEAKRLLSRVAEKLDDNARAGMASEHTTDIEQEVNDWLGNQTAFK